MSNEEKLAEEMVREGSEEKNKERRAKMAEKKGEKRVEAKRSKAGTKASNGVDKMKSMKHGSIQTEDKPPKTAEGYRPVWHRAYTYKSKTGKDINVRGHWEIVKIGGAKPKPKRKSSADIDEEYRAKPKWWEVPNLVISPNQG